MKAVVVVVFAALALAAARPAAAQAANCASALSLIEEAEGLELCTYVDSTNHKTICYGFNLEASGAAQKVEAVGGDWDSVYNHGGCLTQSQCVELLQGAVDEAASGAAAVFGVQCTCIQAVLVDMTYNLGQAGIASFTTFDSYIRAQEWASAADDIKTTLWCRQVGSRCTRDAEIISQGCSGATSQAAGKSPSTKPSLSSSNTAIVVGLCAAVVALVAAVAVLAVRRRRARTWEVTALLDNGSTINYGGAPI